jgi:hypothetical protein
VCSTQVLSGAEGLRLSRRLAGLWPAGRRWCRSGRVAEEVVDGLLASCLEKLRATGNALSDELSNRGEENLASPVHSLTRVTPIGAGC